MKEIDRPKRFHATLPKDQRNPFQQDRDRILYSSSFLRLAGITQVISPFDNNICHNRLTHSLKVAQVARRLTEHLLSKHPNKQKQLNRLGGLDPDVTEAASLAHDLGHPPFGHAAEVALQKSIENVLPGSEDFEGNAQSFRNVTKLSVRSQTFEGLDLTRATLNALLKYPWQWAARGGKNKWGAYKTESDEFNWARTPIKDEEKNSKTLEAEVMDIADDISYAVHDLEDFYKAGLVPLDRLVKSDTDTDSLTEEGQKFVNAVFKRCSGWLPGAEEDLRNAFIDQLARNPITHPYRGSKEERAPIRSYTSRLIGKYINGIDIDFNGEAGHRLTISELIRYEIFMFQQLTWHYVILSPSLSAQQYGQKRLISELFKFYFDAAISGEISLLPLRWQETAIQYFEAVSAIKKRKEFSARLAADIISGMTEREATDNAHKILGINQGRSVD